METAAQGARTPEPASPPPEAGAAASGGEADEVPASGGKLARRLIQNFYVQRRMSRAVVDVMAGSVGTNAGAWSGTRRAVAGRLAHGDDLGDLIRAGLLDAALLPSIQALGYVERVPRAARPAAAPEPAPDLAGGAVAAAPPARAPPPAARDRGTLGHHSRRVLVMRSGVTNLEEAAAEGAHARAREAALRALDSMVTDKALGSRWAAARERKRPGPAGDGAPRVRRLASLTGRGGSGGGLQRGRSLAKKAPPATGGRSRVGSLVMGGGGADEAPPTPAGPPPLSRRGSAATPSKLPAIHRRGSGASAAARLDLGGAGGLGLSGTHLTAAAK